MCSVALEAHLLRTIENETYYRSTASILVEKATCITLCAMLPAVQSGLLGAPESTMPPKLTVQAQ